MINLDKLPRNYAEAFAIHRLHLEGHPHARFIPLSARQKRLVQCVEAVSCVDDLINNGYYSKRRCFAIAAATFKIDDEALRYQYRKIKNITC